MASYLSWSNKFVITYYTDEHGIERKITRRATKDDRLLSYYRPKPCALWKFSNIVQN